MKLQVTKPVKNPKNTYVIRATGYFGDMDESWYFDEEYDVSKEQEVLEILTAFTIIKDERIEEEVKFLEALKEKGIEWEEIDHIYSAWDWNAECFGSVESLTAIYYDGKGKAFEVELVEE